MILLNRLNGTEFYLNAELVEQIDRTPDTVITLTTGNNIVVTQTLEQVIEKILLYRCQVNNRREDKIDKNLKSGVAG